jgi:hypothetical protein
VPALLELDPPPNTRVSPLGVGPSSFLWASGATGGLGGLSFGNRGPLSRDLLSLLARDEAAPLRPRRLVPDRPLDPPDLEAGEARLFTTGALTFRSADGLVTYWVPDTRYEDVTVTLELAPAPGATDRGLAAPVVVFGSTEVGGADTPWPDAPDAAEGRASVTVRRRGGTATLTSGGRSARYTVESGSTALGLRVGNAPVVVAGLTLERD